MSNLIPFQWSKKLDNGEIYVCQDETCEGLGLKKQEVETKLINSRVIPEPIAVPENVPPVPMPTISSKPISPSTICEICGAKAYINTGIYKRASAYHKIGESWTIVKCSKFPELKKIGGHSYFK